MSGKTSAYKTLNGKTMFSLSGKTALVTGGRGLYGSVISEGLAEAGAHVIIASRDRNACETLAKKINADVNAAADDVSGSIENASPGCAEGAELDLGSDASINTMAGYIEGKFGGVDILVNNAVTREHYGGLENAGRDTLLESLDINLAGIVMLTKALISGIMERRGSIINIGSIQGVMGPHFPYYENGQTSPLGYTMEKWGMVGFTKWMAAYYGKSGVRVNCLSPGGYDPGLETTRPEFYARYAEHTPLGKWPDRDDIKGPVIFFASDASRYVTGVNLLMDGGFTIW